MKKIVVLFCLICFGLPVFAWNEQASRKSIEFLNNLVSNNVQHYKDKLIVDYNKISYIIGLYKQNPASIKIDAIHEFGISCVQRNKELLNEYQTKYFKPAFEEYQKYDKSLSYQDWVNSTALSETSAFYDFYTFTESNLNDCQKIVERSK